MAKEVAVQKSQELTAAQVAEMNELYGTGESISNRAEDNIIPLIYILQPMSPQVQAHRPEYIPGAVAGSIWLRNASTPIIPGPTGILFQPCYAWKDWGEWVPRERGGGFAGRFKNKWDGDDVPDCEDALSTIGDSGFPVWTRPNGNDLVFTRNHAGFVLLDGVPLPYVIPFTSSGLSTSKSWNTRMGNKIRKGGGKVDPWVVIYRLRTIPKHNPKGDWFAFDISDAGEQDGYPALNNGDIPRGFVRTKEDIDRGKTFSKGFVDNQRQAEAPMAASVDMKDEIPF
jgi:hypothetical protein